MVFPAWPIDTTVHWYPAKLPVAAVLWKPLPDLETAAEAWILAGGAHHSVLSYGLTAEILRHLAEIMDVEFIHIGRCAGADASRAGA